MNKSESIKALAGALCKVQGEVEHAHKNSVNPHFNNRYADLTEVLDTVLPILTKHGISVMQFPGYVDGVTTVETVLTHESGEWMSGTAGARVQKDDPQGVGSAITYLRRYSLAAVCAIGQEDDDGEAARQPTPMRKLAGEAPQGHVPTVERERARSNGSGLGLVPFGKHKGKSWSDLIQNEPDYVDWAIKNMDRLDTDLKFALKDALQEREAVVAKLNAPLGDGSDLPF